MLISSIAPVQIRGWQIPAVQTVQLMDDAPSRNSYERMMDGDCRKIAKGLILTYESTPFIRWIDHFGADIKLRGKKDEIRAVLGAEFYNRKFHEIDSYFDEETRTIEKIKYLIKIAGHSEPGGINSVPLDKTFVVAQNGKMLDYGEGAEALISDKLIKAANTEIELSHSLKILLRGGKVAIIRTVSIGNSLLESGRFAESYKELTASYFKNIDDYLAGNDETRCTYRITKSGRIIYSKVSTEDAKPL